MKYSWNKRNLILYSLIKELNKAFAGKYLISTEDINPRYRKEHITFAKAFLVYSLRKKSFTFEKIAAIMSAGNHSTVLHNYHMWVTGFRDLKNFKFINEYLQLEYPELMKECSVTYKTCYNPRFSDKFKKIITDNVDYALESKEGLSFVYPFEEVYKQKELASDKEQKLLEIMKLTKTDYIEF